MSSIIRHTNHDPRMTVTGRSIVIGCLFLLLLTLSHSFPRYSLEIAPAADHLMMGNLDVLGAANSPRRVQDLPAATSPITITVKLADVIGHIDARAFGTNLWPTTFNSPDSNYFFRSPTGLAKLQELGVNVIYYSSDRNNWKELYDNLNAVRLPFPWSIDTSEMLNLNANLGTEPMLSVNVTNLCRQADALQAPSPDNVVCVDATPALAADWLRYVNFESSGTPRVKYVALGVEPYAGCQPWRNPRGINCYSKDHGHKIMLTQSQYASRIKQWAQALKAVDPTIKIGAHLQPNTFICQADCGGITWDQTVLERAGQYIDFVIVHQYFMVDQPAPDETTAQKYSYYQSQVDIRVRKGGVTAMPSQIRRELSAWAPTKRRMPIFVSEFTAARVEDDNVPTALSARASLYAGFSTGELFLDLLQPVKLNRKRFPGAMRAFIMEPYGTRFMIARLQPVGQATQSMIFMPSWHVLAALKDFRDKDIIQPTVKGNPLTPAGRQALRAYAVKAGGETWLAVFNHSANQALVADIRLVGAAPLQASVVEVGRDAASFLTQNSEIVPNAVTPTTRDVPSTQLRTWGIRAFEFAPHTMTLIHVVSQ